MIPQRNRARIVRSAVVVCGLALLSAVAGGQERGAQFAGNWWSDDVSNPPWQIEFKVNGPSVTGSIRQGGANPGPAEIYEVEISGERISFKAKSPDNARTINFTGTRSGEEIRFARTVTVPTGGTAGGAGIFGQGGSAEFTAKRDNVRVMAAASARGAAAGARAAGTRGTGRGTAAAATPPPPDPAGAWQITGVPFAPWLLDLKISGAALSGTVRQTGGQAAGPAEIYEGKIEGNAVSFKVRSPDGDRTITFRGRFNGAEMSFNRVVDVRSGGSHGDAGAFGTGPTAIIAKRPPAPAQTQSQN